VTQNLRVGAREVERRSTSCSALQSRRAARRAPRHASEFSSGFQSHVSSEGRGERLPEDSGASQKPGSALRRFGRSPESSSGLQSLGTRRGIFRSLPESGDAPSKSPEIRRIPERASDPSNVFPMLPARRRRFPGSAVSSSTRLNLLRHSASFRRTFRNSRSVSILLRRSRFFCEPAEFSLGLPRLLVASRIFPRALKPSERRPFLQCRSRNSESPQNL
jgi:hypothetical protein